MRINFGWLSSIVWNWIYILALEPRNSSTLHLQLLIELKQRFWNWILITKSNFGDGIIINSNNNAPIADNFELVGFISALLQYRTKQNGNEEEEEEVVEPKNNDAKLQMRFFPNSSISSFSLPVSLGLLPLPFYIHVDLTDSCLQCVRLEFWRRSCGILRMVMLYLYHMVYELCIFARKTFRCSINYLPLLVWLVGAVGAAAFAHIESTSSAKNGRKKITRSNTNCGNPIKIMSKWMEFSCNSRYSMREM